MPLTLMTGWYGMNFKSMPELSSPYGYMVFIVVRLIVVGVLIYWFKKKKFSNNNINNRLIFIYMKLVIQ